MGWDLGAGIGAGSGIRDRLLILLACLIGGMVGWSVSAPLGLYIVRLGVFIGLGGIRYARAGQSRSRQYRSDQGGGGEGRVG